MSEHAIPKRWKGAIAGLIFMAAGGWFTYQILYQGIMSITASAKGLIFLTGPMLFFFGATVLVRGLLMGKNAFSGRNVLYCGLAMLVIGVYPYIYTPLLLGKEKAEVANWLGQLIATCIGYPGILLSIVGFFIRNKNKD